mmetsp:Transcript_53079/g.133594  ORF Transcript_53079/g.133594 Transcript_53079/m.133594 type:complete len:270 (-) Transcript_53079:728-1537(-)
MIDAPRDGKARRVVTSQEQHEDVANSLEIARVRGLVNVKNDRRGVSLLWRRIQELSIHLLTQTPEHPNSTVIPPHITQPIHPMPQRIDEQVPGFLRVLMDGCQQGEGFTVALVVKGMEGIIKCDFSDHVESESGGPLGYIDGQALLGRVQRGTRSIQWHTKNCLLIDQTSFISHPSILPSIHRQSCGHQRDQLVLLPQLLLGGHRHSSCPPRPCLHLLRHPRPHHGRRGETQTRQASAGNAESDSPAPPDLPAGWSPSSPPALPQLHIL